MMAAKGLVILCCCLAVALAGDKYSSKYDDIDIQEILSNKRLLTAYINCVLGKGKCSPEGQMLKDNLQDALETGCEKCTEAQEDKSTTIIGHLVEHEREMWDELTKVFDPTGKWRKVYEDRARAKGIKIPE